MDKKLMSIGVPMLVLKLLEGRDMYGYQIIKELEQQSEHVFELKEGTLYPILHALEEKLAIISYEKEAETGRIRKYYQLTKMGHKLLAEKEQEWNQYQHTISKILKGGACYV